MYLGLIESWSASPYTTSGDAQVTREVIDLVLMTSARDGAGTDAEVAATKVEVVVSFTTDEVRGEFKVNEMR